MPPLPPLPPASYASDIYMYIYQWRRKVPKSGGGGGGHIHTYIYVPSVKNQYKRDVIEYMVIYVMVIEIFHKIINRYMKDAK